MQHEPDNKYPLVSVLCFCRNCVHTIQKCIDSIIAQDYPNLEIIVQDGASTDGTLEILREYCEKIKLVSEPDSGPEEGFIRTFSRITGDYFCFCLSDEELLPHSISWRVENIQKHPEAAVIYCDHYITDIHGNITGKVTPPEWDFEAYFCCQFTPPICAALFRTSCYKAIDTSTYDGYDEFEIWVRLGIKFPICYVPCHLPVAKYAVHPEALGYQANRMEKRARARKEVIEKICSNPETPEHIRSLRDKAIAGVYIWYVNAFCRIGLWDSVKNEAYLAFKSGASPQMLHQLACKIYNHSMELCQNGQLKEALEFLDVLIRCNVVSHEIDALREQILAQLAESRQAARSEQSNYYGEEYFDFQKKIGSFGGKANLFKFEEFINITDTVVDFGCGGGYLLSNINCKRKIGVEVNPFARREAVAQGIYVVDNIDALDDKVADVIISNHALEHVDGPLDALKSLYSKLKVNGKIIFVVPHQDTKDEYDPGDKNNHLYTWNQMTLGNLFSKAGYKVLRSEAFQHQWPLDYVDIYSQYGQEEFHKRCREYAVDNDNYQIRVVATRDSILGVKHEECADNINMLQSAMAYITGLEGLGEA